MELIAKHKMLQSMETPVLIAWVKRTVARAEASFAESAAAMNPARDDQGKILYDPKDGGRLWCAQSQLEHAAGFLAALVADPGQPVTVQTDPADFGTSTFTFSREQKAADAVGCAAKAIAGLIHKKGQHLPVLAASIEDEAFAELTRNIGVEA